MMSLQGTVCVKFTPKQYMKLYECGLLFANNEPLRTSEAVLTSLVGHSGGALKKWLATENSINKPLTGSPNRNDCPN